MNKIINNQITAAIIQEGLSQKELLKQTTILNIQSVASEKIQNAYTALDTSLECVENVRDFVSHPEHILGSDLSKHGEIAERIEVEIGNGRRILRNLSPNRTIDINRTAPEDYFIDGIAVQSKFAIGARNSLQHVLDHLRTYENFTADGGFYHIPKDQHELLTKVVNGENLEGISTRTVNKYKELILQIEQETGKPFSEVVQSGISNYDEVQLGKVGGTLDGYENEFKETSAKEVKEIREKCNRQTEDAQHITDASWGEALKYSAVSATIGGVTSAGIKIYSKIHSGTKITDFSCSDWKDIGYDFAKGGAKGGVSGLGIYGLTKLCHFAAPFAGAVVSTTMGMTSIVLEYKNGKMSKVEFSESACSLSVEAGISAIGTVIGQAVIPIPILGAIVGAATAKASLSICQYLFGQKESELLTQMQKDYEELVTNLDEKAREIIQQMEEYYSKLGGYINAALSKESAVRFYGSIELCRFLKVPELCIIHNIHELDDYMLA